MSGKLRWGVLGTSFISGVMAEALKASTMSEATAVASRSMDNAKQFAKEYALAKYYDNHQAILDDEEIDVVYIALPNHLHAEFVIRAAEAGKHVLCEKPFATTEEDARRAFAVAESSGVICMEGLMYRHHPFTKKLQEIVANKTIGDIKLIHAAYSANIADFANGEAGGSIRNLGCYPLSLVRLLVDAEPVAINALGRMNPKTHNDNQASAVMQFPDDIVAVVSSCDDMEMFWQFDVYGTHGYLKVVTNPWLPEQKCNQVIVKCYDDEGDSSTITVDADKSLFTYQVDDISQTILNTSKPLGVMPEESIANVAVLQRWLDLIVSPQITPTSVCA